jgi:predicted nucleotide-binding protein (sugar kinase/HSP70/actin superfamily)
VREETTLDSESWLRELVGEERARLLAESGLDPDPPEQYCLPAERPFTKADRDRTTILIGGLTRAHNRLLQAAGRALGYNVGVVPVPDKNDFHTGRAYANTGMCNPVYFTLGALVNHLCRLRDEEGMEVDEIIDRHVFATFGSCGPCRFGMYESEYRTALAQSGFPGFRVLVFEQRPEKREDDSSSGLVIDATIFLVCTYSVFLGDVLNMAAHSLRPYEVEKGSTDRALGEAIELLAGRIERSDPYGRAPGWPLAFLGKLFGHEPALLRLCFDYSWRGEFARYAREAASLLRDAVEVDFTRPKPACKVIGEFWAQTTEGDGNFRMFDMLLENGAEVRAEPIAVWLTYLVAQALMDRVDRRGIDGVRTGTLGERLQAGMRNLRKRLLLGFAYRYMSHEFEKLRRAAGSPGHPLADQFRLQRLAAPFYNRRARGGEGYLEVAKTIECTLDNKAHLILSLKPFGCLPSTQSDGAQAAVQAAYPECHYLSVETSGEGDVNAHSRVLMALSEARARCRAEFEASLGHTGVPLDEIRAYANEHPELRRGLRPWPRRYKAAGTAARFVQLVAARMAADPAWPCRAVRDRVPE